MTIVYRPPSHSCLPPAPSRRRPKGTIWRCDECDAYYVSSGNGSWSPPFPFGPTARRIKRIEQERAA